ncbi:ABC transporter permease [Ruminococcus flavefaciens]|uniref:ABC-type transport system, involved in lipoprotein release, permease component n=1 Tax=Ruminococcus flavefaciens TaxID=1265 RepID=A0A1M7MPN9_RUMFL|nr:ABC transporter permease [Ruminococcus flavefaciens]SHM93041.1 ABC-type transport system, involved in lipoprotein release, permease component [Ruminococcus flavefaciens]
MFFKMLKKDLKCKKGLNVILFIFITVASVLVFAGSVEIYSYLTGEKRMTKLCNISSADMMVMGSVAEDEEKTKKLEQILNDYKDVEKYYSCDMTRINSLRMDYPNIQEDESNSFFRKQTYLMKLPREYDLLYDTNDMPFSLKSGTIACPVGFSTSIGLRIGDKVRFTTSMGDIYELEVARFFKESGFTARNRIIVADEDYDTLTKDEVRKMKDYGLFIRDCNSVKVDEIFTNLKAEEIICPIYMKNDFSDDSFIMQAIVSVFVVIISAFLIAIIFMTIRFTMIADLKREEKEIGMMKALGVDSFSFRWLFAAKYIAFAVIGGTIGIAAGIPISGLVVNLFNANVILPQKYETIIIGIIAVLAIIAMMIGFSLMVMRRISKISVIDSIHGENCGERFGKGFPLFLHKRKKMSVPFFLAITDILGRFKRYIFLIIAYTLGAAIILLAYNVRNSIISKNYMKLFLYHTIDFDVRLRGDFEKEVDKRCEAEGKNIHAVINELFEENGFPAYIDTLNCSWGSLLNEKGDKVKNFDIIWGENIDKLRYRNGGRMPELENEAAMSYFTASKLGIKLGDVVTVDISEESEDGLSTDNVKRQLVITAFFDYFEAGSPEIIMGKDYRKGQEIYPKDWIGYVIDAPESQKEGIVKAMKKRFGGDAIRSWQESLKEDQMAEYDRLFALLEYVLGGAVMFVLILITYLYSTVFVTEETSEIALLKSTGFTDGSIRKWHLLRMAVLVVFSVVLAEVLFKTLGQLLMTKFMESYEVTGVNFLPEITVSFIIIPLIVLGAVLLTVALTLKSIRNIGIWKISEE